MHWAVGNVVRGSHRSPTGVVRNGTYRVTAVHHPRVYVDHVGGYRFCAGVRGWTNLWFDARDERMECV